MAEFTVEGIVLRRWDSGESDRRIAVLTPNRGKIYLTARGARKSGARLAPFTEPATYATFAVGARKNAYLTQVQPLKAFPALRSDYTRLMASLALLETVDAVTPEDQPLPEVFGDCLMGIEAIAAADPIAALCWIDLRLMATTGHGPDFSKPSLWLSPEDGGPATSTSNDAFEVSKEVSITLKKLQEFDQPPPKLKAGKETAIAILKFWETYAHKKLSARRSLTESL